MKSQQIKSDLFLLTDFLCHIGQGVFLEMLQVEGFT
ncbi:hypothetical protein LLNZ_09565 [Lactococcus cremoris subsp. cremoris NZ9000]|nr:hypothetical protein LLNZ_09565 [Lactococcus cremoris subsp. cremoris NZ9000]